MLWGSQTLLLVYDHSRELPRPNLHIHILLFCLDKADSRHFPSRLHTHQHELGPLNRDVGHRTIRQLQVAQLLEVHRVER